MKCQFVVLLAVSALTIIGGCSDDWRHGATPDGVRSLRDAGSREKPSSADKKKDGGDDRAVGSADATIDPLDASAPDAGPKPTRPEPEKPAEPGAGTPPSPPAAAPDASSEVKPGDPPCEVAVVLKKHCASCHGKVLRQGAPFPLVDAADFQRDIGGQTVGAAVLRRMRDDVRPMPPPPAPRATGEQIVALEAWIESGALPGDPGCSADDSSSDPTELPIDPEDETVTRPDAGPSVPADAGSGEPPAAEPEPEPEPSAWPMFGADLANSRNNARETTISPDNVEGLREQWRFNGPSTTSAPAVVDGVVYLPGWNGRVYALRLDDGSSVWTASLPDLIDSSPTVTDSRVIVSDDEGSVHSLDRTTGVVQWSRRVHDHAEAHLWSSPIYVPSAGLIVVGVASGEEAVPKAVYTFRGAVVGLDADSGEVRWRFETASEADGFGPGVGSWGTAAVDEARKLMFIGTGNNYQPPYSDYSDSMLAIEYETGELAWHRQFTAGDAYTIYGAQGPDYDIGSSANLFSVEGRDFVGIGVKSGHYFALDRETGEIVWRTTITPGSVLGGVISASAYAGGLIFVASNEFLASASAAVAIDARNGEIVWRQSYGSLTYGGVAHANGVAYFGSTSGSVFAYDAASGELLWTDRTPSSQPIAGSPTVANGRLLVPWGYQWTLREGNSGTGGMTVYGL